MIYKSLLTRLSCTILLSCMVLASFGQASPKAGKTTFKNLCAACHNKNMKSVLTGPALGGTLERWSEYPQEDLYAWVRNSSALVETGHPKAVEVFNASNKVLMTSFPDLSDEDIESLFLYIEGVYDGSFGAKPKVAASESSSGAGDQSSSNFLYYIIFGFLVAMALVLTRVLNRLKHITDVNEGVETEGPKSVWSTLTSKKAVSMMIFALIVLGGYATVNNALGLNRMQDFQPEQPIKFSHETHAGLHKIECQFCHDGARRSKHSVIPSTNTCMNCHRAIKYGSKYGTGEITKIYASIGYDPIKDVYIENYEEMELGDIKKIYTNWIANQYVEENAKLDRKGERLMDSQWKDIVSSLTSKAKPNIPGPIEWIRVHNLPDHVYYNHSQHVTVGQIECQKCHGPVEKMEVVKQYAPLSMGWCINCHRQTEVKFTDNPYYTSYEKYHEEIQNGTRDKVTVEEIGGLECQKCHY